VDRLYLPDSVWFSFCGTGAVFCDLRNDQYIEIDEEKSAALRELVTNDGAANKRTLSVLDEMISYGLLTPREDNARPISPTAIIAASTQAPEEHEAAPGKISAREVANFVYACLNVDLRLRWGHIFNTVSRVKQLKAQTRKHPIAIDRLRELAGVFRTLRPLYPRPYLCLFDTLASLKFLARYGIFPTYVAGYDPRAGEAHCWAQVDDLLILDNPERVAQYTPIVAI
jgi:Transglutaminase-like superfamily